LGEFPYQRDSMPLKMDRQNSILESITNALQFYASRQVGTRFIKRFTVRTTSHVSAVQANLTQLWTKTVNGIEC
jgi:hypothetical protein